jgi:hypothetical protein
MVGADLEIFATLPGLSPSVAKSFGGRLVKGNPRSARPMSTRKPVHLVLNASVGLGSKSLLNPRFAKRIQKIVYRSGRKLGVKVYRFANAGTHLHLVILPCSKKAYLSFIRGISGLIARLVTGRERSVAENSANQKQNSKHIRFWDARPFTRILEWGRDYAVASRFLKQKSLAALGFVKTKEKFPPSDKDQVFEGQLQT